MPADREKTIDILRRSHIFRNVEDARIEAVVDQGRFGSADFASGEFVYRQDEDPQHFYFVISGRFRRVRASSAGQPETIGYVEQGEYFGEEVLETDWPRQTSIEVLEDSSVITLTVDDFKQLLADLPQIEKALRVILDSYRLLLKSKFEWMNTDETIYFIARRHVMFLVTRILPPLVFGAVTIPVLLFIEFKALMALTPTVVLLLAVLITLLWLLWSYIDWTNDYCIITNQRALFQEKVVLLYDSRQESPLEAIQSTSISSTQLGRILGYGNVVIRTFYGTILFRDVAFPEQVMALVQDYQVRAQIVQKYSELRDIKARLDKRMTKGPQLPPPVRSFKPPAPPSASQQFLANMFHLRYEAGGTVIYRTHWFMLLRKIWLPLMLALALIGLFIASAVSQFAALSFQATCGLTFIVGFFVFGWLGYQYMDWHNDIYLITPDQVVDVNKKPLGREERRAAPLKNIQNIEYERLGIIGLILNYGTVYIQVGDQKLTFDDVLNPSEVQRELFHRLIRKTTADRQAQAESDRQRLADWIVTYDEMKQRREQPPSPQNPPARRGF